MNILILKTGKWADSAPSLAPRYLKEGIIYSDLSVFIANEVIANKCGKEVAEVDESDSEEFSEETSQEIAEETEKEAEESEDADGERVPIEEFPVEEVKRRGRPKGSKNTK